MHWFLYLTSCNSFMTAYGSTLENFLNMCAEALSCVRVTDQRNDHWLRADSWSSVWITLHFTVPLFLNRLRFESRRYITCVLVKRHCIKFNAYRAGFDLGICAFHTVKVNLRGTISRARAPNTHEMWLIGRGDRDFARKWTYLDPPEKLHTFGCCLWKQIHVRCHSVLRMGATITKVVFT